MSICYITETATGALIRQEAETYFQAAQWCRLNGYKAAEVLFSATPPRAARITLEQAAFAATRPTRDMYIIVRRPSLWARVRRLFICVSS